MIEKNLYKGRVDLTVASELTTAIVDLDALGRQFLAFGRQRPFARREQFIHFRLKIGDGLPLRVQRSLLFRLILDQLTDGHFGRDLFLLPQVPEFLGWYGCHYDESFAK